MIKPVPTNYRVVIDVTLGEGHLVTLDLTKPKQLVQYLLLCKLGFTEKEMAVQDDMITVKCPHEFAKGTYSTKTGLFLDMYWKVAKMLQCEVSDEDEKYINHMTLDISDKDDVELVVMRINFRKLH